MLSRPFDSPPNPADPPRVAATGTSCCHAAALSDDRTSAIGAVSPDEYAPDLVGRFLATARFGKQVLRQAVSHSATVRAAPGSRVSSDAWSGRGWWISTRSRRAAHQLEVHSSQHPLISGSFAPRDRLGRRSQASRRVVGVIRLWRGGREGSRHGLRVDTSLKCPRGLDRLTRSCGPSTVG